MRIILLGIFFLLPGTLTAQNTEVKADKPRTINTYSSKQNIPLPDNIKGNWFCAEQPNQWEYGIYDSITILQNRIFKNETIRKKKDFIELTVKNPENGRATILLLTPQADGKCRISVNGEKGKLCTKERSSTPVITTDNGYQNFFSQDSVCLQGYIEGYSPDLGFGTGIINQTNELTLEDYPTVIPIRPDGSFRCTLLATHPFCQTAVFKGERFPFYIEPGQALTLYINWNHVRHNRERLPDSALYMGPSAPFSYLVSDINKVTNSNTGDMHKLLKTITPAQYKEHMRPFIRQWKQAGDSLCRIHATSLKAKRLIQNTISQKSASALFNFLLYRRSYARRDTTNQVLKVQADDSYYDFLKELPLDDETMLAVAGVHIFINRFEYMQPLEKAYTALMSLKPGKSPLDIDKNKMRLSISLRHQKDTIINKFCNQPNPLLWQIAKVRSLYYDLINIKDDKIAREHTDQLKEEITHPAVIAVAEELFQNSHPEEGKKSYQLPKGRATEIFRNITRNHPGKVLFVDFWATTCGACRVGIEATADLREKYKNHPKFQFIYISGARESPKTAYEKYVEKNLKGEASYYVTGTEFNYLRQLFHFNGIPHYELVEEDGSISKENLSPHNIEEYLEKRFGGADSGNTTD